MSAEVNEANTVVHTFYHDHIKAEVFHSEYKSVYDKCHYMISEHYSFDENNSEDKEKEDAILKAIATTGLIKCFDKLAAKDHGMRKPYNIEYSIDCFTDIIVVRYSLICHNPIDSCSYTYCIHLKDKTPQYIEGRGRISDDTLRREERTPLKNGKAHGLKISKVRYNSNSESDMLSYYFDYFNNGENICSIMASTSDIQRSYVSVPENSPHLDICRNCEHLGCIDNDSTDQSRHTINCDCLPWFNQEYFGDVNRSWRKWCPQEKKHLELCRQETM